MSQSRRARLHLARLDDRVLPSSVTATTTARSFDFTGTGTLATSRQFGGVDPAEETTTNSVTVGGSIHYGDESSGASGAVTISGTGTGDRHSGAAPGDPFAQTVVGKFSFEDAGGTATTIDPLTLTQTRLTPEGKNQVEPYGPVDAEGSFDVSKLQLILDWDTTGGSDGVAGNLTVNLADKNTAATDLAFGSTKSAHVDGAGNVELDFTVNVTGKIATAASQTAEIARITAIWQGAGKSQATDIEVPVFWNTGSIEINADDLTPPDWAETLTVRLDAAGQLAEGNEGNNTWTVAIDDLGIPVEGDPGVPAPPVVVPPPVIDPPVPVTDPVPIDPMPVPAGFRLVTSGATTLVEWRDAQDRVVGMVQALDDFAGPVGIAAGDVTGDGVIDAVVAAGSGGGPRVRVFDGRTGQLHSDFFAYDSSFRGGVSVAVADLNQDGHSEIIAGAGEGGGPHVRIFDGQTGQVIGQFFAYDPEFRGGVRVAAGDLDGDGVTEVITGTGPGGGPVLAVFDAPSGAERLRLLAGKDEDRGGVEVRAATDSTGLVIVTADPEGDSPARRFRSQLNPSEGLLVPMIDPIVPPPPVFHG